MEMSHRLKDILQLQLASDAYAVSHLPFILETLTKNDFLPSAHTQKWIARVNSLMHAKDAAVKWSGLCLAFQTAIFSKDIMLECAQGWVGVAMPLLVNQPPPTTKAAIRLLRFVFSNAMDVPEFQRQLCVPNVPKFANALIAIVEKDEDPEKTLLSIETLTHIVSLHPSLCRPLHGALSNVALRQLNGSAPTPASFDLVEASSRLYAVLPLTGGKVNAPILWRKCLEDTVAFAWGAFLQLRTSYPNTEYGNILRPGPLAEDPVVAVPLAIDRLRAAVRVIYDLVNTNIPRPVSLPIGSLVRLCLALLRCSPDDKADVHADHVTHSLEQASIPLLWSHACGLLRSVSHTGRQHLTPHLPMLLTQLAHHLEQPHATQHTLQVLRVISALLSDGAQFYDEIVASRLARATMPLLATVLSTRSSNKANDEANVTQTKTTKGKKRGRGYEGDEVFKIRREVLCPTEVEGQVLLASVDVFESLLLLTPVSAPVHSIATRLLLSIYASIPQLPPALLSPDLSLHQLLYAKVQRVCVNLAIGTSSTMSKSLGLVLNISDGTLGANGDSLVPAEVELLLHPRVPPLVRSLPHVEMLSLFRTEEGEEEKDTRERIGLVALGEREDGLSELASSVPPQAAIGATQVSSPSALQPPPEAATNIGTSMERGLVAMHVDDPATSTSVPVDSRPSNFGIDLRPSDSSRFSTVNNQIPQTSLPPPPDPLPSSSTTLGSGSTVSVFPSMDFVNPKPVPTDEDDEDDEPMPTIDMGSDSDAD